MFSNQDRTDRSDRDSTTEAVRLHIRNRFEENRPVHPAAGGPTTKQLLNPVEPCCMLPLCPSILNPKYVHTSVANSHFQKFAKLARCHQPATETDNDSRVVKIRKMEEYLQYMKNLRTHMNDVEDQAAKISVEEQMQITTIETLTKEIDLAESDIKRLNEAFDLMNNAKGDICSKILERQRKISLMEKDSSTLSQTLELIQQERVNLSTKLVEKRTSYAKTEVELNAKLKEQQDWLNSYKSNLMSGQHSWVNTEIDHRVNEHAVGNTDAKIRVTSGNDVKESLEELKSRMDTYDPKLRDMSSEALEEEVRALMSDKSGEIEYQESMQNQICSIKEISHIVKCGCGAEYKVEVDHHV
ncbi:hypothetical protein R6Q57_009311 [Mikania cordata]